ncbi:MAG: hypothetical protein ACI8S6_005271, partial [Myxococcota bacterium]
MDNLPLELIYSLPLELIGGVIAGVIAVIFVIGGIIRGRRVPQLDDGDLDERPMVTDRASDGLAARFFTGLARSRSVLSDSLLRAFGGDRIDPEALEALEDALISADVGVHTATALSDVLRKKA